MSDPLLLAYDLGTTALKATLIDAEGNLRAAAERSYPTRHNGRSVEQHPQDWWSCVCASTQELASAHPQDVQRVAAIGVCGHMSGCLALDAHGEPLAPAMTHADSRARAQARRIADAIGAQPLYQRTGCILDPKNTLCKILWMRENLPDIYRRTAFFVQSKDYLAFQLTGNMDTTDFSDASHAMLMDIHARRYLDAELRELGLDADKLPALHRSTEVIGALTESAAAQLGLRSGIPVVAGGGDGACATAGAGVSQPGDIYCSLGTTAWITRVSAQAVIDPQARIFDILSLNGDSFGVFGTMQTAGRALSWARDLFGLESMEQMNALAANAPAGSDGLIFLPYLEGERSPVFDSNARGVFLGASVEHGREHFLRAVLEGTAYALRSILEVYRDDARVERLRVIGGGTRSPEWLRILADICQIELETVGENATGQTALGAAVAAGVGAGIYEDLRAAERFIRPQSLVQPDAGKADVYEAGFRKYMRLYPSVKDLFE